MARFIIFLAVLASVHGSPVNLIGKWDPTTTTPSSPQTETTLLIEPPTTNTLGLSPPTSGFGLPSAYHDSIKSKKTKSLELKFLQATKTKLLNEVMSLKSTESKLHLELAKLQQDLDVLQTTKNKSLEELELLRSAKAKSLKDVKLKRITKAKSLTKAESLEAFHFLVGTEVQ